MKRKESRLNQMRCRFLMNLSLIPVIGFRVTRKEKRKDLSLSLSSLAVVKKDLSSNGFLIDINFHYQDPQESMMICRTFMIFGINKSKGRERERDSLSMTGCTPSFKFVDDEKDRIRGAKTHRR
jgi:hypothetical protein